MFRTQRARTFLAVALFLALLMLAQLLVEGLLHSGPYLLPGLLALGLLLRATARIAKKRGWGIEGRLTRFLSRPRLVDESRQSR